MPNIFAALCLVIAAPVVAGEFKAHPTNFYTEYEVSNKIINQITPIYISLYEVEIDDIPYSEWATSSGDAAIDLAKSAAKAILDGDRDAYKSITSNSSSPKLEVSIFDDEQTNFVQYLHQNKLNVKITHYIELKNYKIFVLNWGEELSGLEDIRHSTLFLKFDDATQEYSVVNSHRHFSHFARMVSRIFASKHRNQSVYSAIDTMQKEYAIEIDYNENGTIGAGDFKLHFDGEEPDLTLSKLFVDGEYVSEVEGLTNSTGTESAIKFVHDTFSTFCAIESIDSGVDPNLIAFKSCMTTESAEGFVTRVKDDYFNDLYKPIFCDNFNIRFIIDCDPYLLFYVTMQPMGANVTNLPLMLIIRKIENSHKLCGIFHDRDMYHFFAMESLNKEVRNLINDINGEK